MTNFSELPLFSGNQECECQKMVDCFGAPQKLYRPGEIIYVYGETQGIIGILQSGSALLSKIDVNGDRTVLERLETGGVFGELIAFGSLPCDEVSVVCQQACTVLFIPRSKLASPCEKACACHRTLIENMLALLSQKAFFLSQRVEVLSCRTIREKLLCCLRHFAAREKSTTFTLPYSLSALADYICSDRSAMMRELKKLKDEGFLEVNGRQVRFLSPLSPDDPSLCAASTA